MLQPSPRLPASSQPTLASTGAVPANPTVTMLQLPSTTASARAGEEIGQPPNPPTATFKGRTTIGRRRALQLLFCDGSSVTRFVPQVLVSIYSGFDSVGARLGAAEIEMHVTPPLALIQGDGHSLPLSMITQVPTLNILLSRVTYSAVATCCGKPERMPETVRMGVPRCIPFPSMVFLRISLSCMQPRIFSTVIPRHSSPNLST